MSIADRSQSYSLSDRLNRSFGKLQFVGKKRLDFYKKLATLLANNVPMAAALDTIQRTSSVNGRKPFAPAALAAEGVRRRIQEGASISDALSDWVPERDMMVLRAADFGSPLKPLENVIGLNTAINKIQSAFVGALSYPAVVIAIAFAVAIGISTNIVPAFTEVVPDVEWTGTAYYFVHVANNVAVWWPFYIAGIIIGLILFVMSLPLWSGGMRAFFDRIPPWSIYRLWMGSGWLLSLSAMLSAGITEIDALTQMNQMRGKWIRVRNNAIRFRVANGMSLGDAMMDTGYDFPDTEINLTIAVYAGLSSADNAIKQVAEEWINESEQRIQTQATVMRSLALLFAASIIAITVLSIFDMEGQITSNLGI